MSLMLCSYRSYVPQFQVHQHSIPAGEQVSICTLLWRIKSAHSLSGFHTPVPLHSEKCIQSPLENPVVVTIPTLFRGPNFKNLNRDSCSLLAVSPCKIKTQAICFQYPMSKDKHSYSKSKKEFSNKIPDCNKANTQWGTHQITYLLCPSLRAHVSIIGSPGSLSSPALWASG